MAKRANEESVVDLTLDSDDEKPIVSPAKKVAVEPRRPGTSPKKPVLLEGTVRAPLCLFCRRTSLCLS